ncbi:MAG: AAA family ATPase [Coleofasciculaceae cyanobacterium]
MTQTIYKSQPTQERQFEQDSSSQTEKTGYLGLPFLLTNEVWPAQIKGFFQEPSFFTKPAPGNYLIISTPDTSETWIRQQAYRLIGYGITNIKVLRLAEPLKSFVEVDVTPFLKLALEMDENSLCGPISYFEWENYLFDEPLFLDQALKYAEWVILKVEPQDRLRASISLDGLRRRAKVSEYNWDKKYLAQIREKLEKDFEASVNDPNQRLKLEVKAYAKETDPYRRKTLRKKICTHYSISKSDLEELLQYEQNTTLQPQDDIYGFDNFFNEETQALEWIIPGLLPRGETILLPALAKCGKTSLATDIIYAVLSGEPIFGSKPGVKGKIIFVTSDESNNTTRRRLRARGVDLLDERHNLKFMPYLDITNLGKLEKQLEDFRPDLVIIDSLTTITDKVGVSEKDSEFARYIYKLKNLLGQYGAAGILTHHENKDPLAKGINKVSGNARIPAAVWGIAQLSAVDPNNDSDPRRWLSIKPREGAATTLSLEINPRDLWALKGIFEFLGEKGDEQGEKRTQGERVLALLRKYSPRGLEYKEIDSYLQLGKKLYTVLDRLEDRQLITKRRSATNPRKWVYAAPENVTESNSHLERTLCDTVSVDVSSQSSESVDIKETEVSQQLVYKDSTTSLQTSNAQQSLNGSNPDSDSDSASSQQIGENDQILKERGCSAQLSDTEPEQLDRQEESCQKQLESTDTTAPVTTYEEVIEALNHLQSKKELSLLVSRHGLELIDGLSAWVEPISQKLKLQQWLKR